MRLFLIISGLSALAYSACTIVPKTGNTSLTTLDRRCEPYDFLTFQRTWPDTVFDWKGWRNTLNQIHDEARTAVTERDENPCLGNASGLTSWTEQGPANHPGRINTIAVKPDDGNTLLVGFAGGGIFKSTDGALTWYPVFDDHPLLSIGAISFDPQQPQVVYAGTGDVNMPSILYNGNGVYKSTDAGETWQYLGLDDKGIVSNIIVHPTQPNVLLVSTMGNPYQRDNNRGIFRSTNGGQTWQHVLFVSNQAGCISMETSISNPDIIYATFWDRIRNNTESIISGPNAKVYKSTDNGVTWTQLGGGLPTGKLGRSGVAVSQQNPDKAYVVFIDTTSRPAYLMRTTNGGQTWTEIANNTLLTTTADFGWYFGKLSLNPNNDDDIYHHGILLWRKANANAAFQVAAGGHSDSHDMAFTSFGRRYWANDGGLYRNDGGSQWIKSTGLPTYQCYRTSFNPHVPTHYWAGAQDNGIKRGNKGVLNNWFEVYSSDGFRTVFDPNNPMRYWTEIQNGSVAVTENGGQTWTGTPVAFGTQDRVNWDAPFFMSQHGSGQLYGATYRVLTSITGQGWSPISPDLTDGVIYGPRFHVITALSESPLSESKFFAGTSDGNVWRKDPLGSWTNVTGNLPERYVTAVIGSPTTDQRIFVTHSGFRANDQTPHIHRSDDNGASWVNIAGNMPAIPVNGLLVIPDHADSLLVAATDAGVYVTKNGGANWELLGKDLPFVPVFDLLHNKVTKEVVAALHGRGIWTFPVDSLLTQVQPEPEYASVGGQASDWLGEPMRNYEVAATGVLSVDDASGEFTLDSVPACLPLIIRPVRNYDILNGVTTYDLVLMSRHILNVEPLDSPYKILAADANLSRTLTNFDIVSLRKIILGVDSILPNGNKSWRFIPAGTVFDQPDNPYLTPLADSVLVDDPTMAPLTQWVAFKVGDVNQSADPTLLVAPDERGSQTWTVLIENRMAEPGQTLRVPLRAAMSTLAGAQFTLHFDPESLEYLGTELSGSTGIDWYDHASAGKLTCMVENTRLNLNKQWLQVSNADTTIELATLVFRVKQRAALPTVFSLSDAPTTSVAYRAGGQADTPVLQFYDQQVEQLRIWPNPADRGMIWVQWPGNSPARITVSDQAGRVVQSGRYPGGLPAGLQGKSLQTGTYSIRVDSGRQVWTGKVVVGQ